VSDVTAENPPCCEAPNLHWESRQIVDRFADVLACSNCRRTHKVEDWAISLALPSADHCVNCGGQVAIDPNRPRHGMPDREERCLSCGLTPVDAKKLHRKLAYLHPSHTYLAAAEAAMEGGRTVLAFKLATAHLAYKDDDRKARELRLQALEHLAMTDQALAEAWLWFDDGGPSDVLSLIAALEAARGNLQGTVEALERGLRMDPQNVSMWTDFAELQAHFDQRDQALEAASYGLADPQFVPRCLEVIGTIAERYYDQEMLPAALEAVGRAGALKQDHVTLSWLTARIAARLRQWEEAQAWLEVTLTLDPEHELARDALNRMRPADSKKKGWFGWLGGSNNT
jgi:tetratricopeptide (TPR) repeat protein